MRDLYWQHFWYIIMQIPKKIKTAGNPIDYLPYKIISIKLKLFHLICSFLSNRFSYSFRTSCTYHLMRFSINSYRSNDTVHKVDPNTLLLNSHQLVTYIPPSSFQSRLTCFQFLPEEISDYQSVLMSHLTSRIL